MIFLRRDAPLGNGVTDFFCRIPVVLASRRSFRGGGAHSLYLPPRSAPVTRVLCMRTMLRNWPTSQQTAFLCSLKQAQLVGRNDSSFSTCANISFVVLMKFIVAV